MALQQNRRGDNSRSQRGQRSGGGRGEEDAGPAESHEGPEKGRKRRATRLPEHGSPPAQKHAGAPACSLLHIPIMRTLRLLDVGGSGLRSSLFVDGS
jgi:hypothetical protein